MSEIYQTAFLKLAGRASGAGRLESPDATTTTHNPMCGDRIILDLQLDGDRITGIGYEIRACLVCQASTSIVGETAVGQTLDDMKARKVALQAFLKDERDAPDDYCDFLPVQAHISRHSCVLLPYQAIQDAVSAAIKG
ncbi:MAG: iron-sulfur cluster assembly scaffold protein [Minwuia sp.]|nr:iron-sulfur cluster assembly scaffold protein [Minwuia sp.]